MRNFDKQQILIIVVAVISIGGFGVLRYLPLASRTRDVNAARDEFEVGDGEVKKQARQIPILDAKMEQIKTEVGDFDHKVPYGRGFASLYDQIADMMEEHNLSGQYIQPRKETTGKGISSIPLSFECSGTLNDVFEFFRSLESFDRLIRIESIEMSSKLEQDVVGVKANAVVYYRGNSDGNRGAK